MNKGLISTLQHYSTKDGPGIRTTVFVVGCNLRCTWCANPELIEPTKKLLYYKQHCIRCGTCSKLEPHAIQIFEDGCHIDRTKLHNIQKIVECCPKNAYEIKGREISAKDLVNLLLRDKTFYEVSNGGITFSGGDPMLQADFVKEAAQLLHQNGIHVALDTAGNVQWSILKNLLQDIDLILFDIKAIDPIYHKECTGVTNEKIIENVKKIAQLKKDLWIRLVIVPGWNDDLEDIEKRFQLINSLGDCVKRVDILKYHNLGSSKYEQLGLKYSISKDTACSDTLVQQIKTIAHSYNVKINVDN